MAKVKKALAGGLAGGLAAVGGFTLSGAGLADEAGRFVGLFVGGFVVGFVAVYTAPRNAA